MPLENSTECALCSVRECVRKGHATSRLTESKPKGTLSLSTRNTIMMRVEKSQTSNRPSDTLPSRAAK